MGTVVIDRQLYVRKIDNMQTDRSRISCHFFRQVHHLLLRPLGCIRRRVKIDSVYFDSPLCNHPSGHRRVYTAGQAKHGAAVASHRHASRPRQHFGIDINPVPDLKIKQYLRLMHIHVHGRKCLQNRFAKRRIDFHGSEREALVYAAGFDFEAG